MKLLEKNNFKCFSRKTADLELRWFRNDGNGLLCGPVLGMFPLLCVLTPVDRVLH